jgi:hypothetical protein
LSRLLTLRETIVSKIKVVCPELKDVAGHHGRFTESELEKFVTSAPAARVAILGLGYPQQISDEGVDYRVSVGVYVATRDGAQTNDRDEQAISAIERIMILADRTRWKLPFCQPCDVGGAQNLYSAQGLKDGIALWAVDLRQVVRLARLVSPSQGQAQALFLGQAPNIGPGHEQDYTKIGLAG